VAEPRADGKASKLSTIRTSAAILDEAEILLASAMNVKFL
jgi:hypothetical protein